MSIGQAIASSAGLKFAAGGLAGALALGGGAMATGHLSCETIAPEVMGNLLVETGLDGEAQAQVETRRIEVEGFGFVDVAHSDSEVEVVDLQENDGVTTEVRSQDQGALEIDFTLDGVTRTLLVTVVDGELFASLVAAGSADGLASTDFSIDAEADASADGASSTEGDASVGFEVLGDLLSGFGIDLGLDG